MSHESWNRVASPPRLLPLSLRLRVLLGGEWVIFGWIFFVGGASLAMDLLGQAGVVGPAASELRRTMARIYNIAPLVGDPEYEVLEYQFFEVWGSARVRKGTGAYARGSTLDVEYWPRNAWWNRAAGQDWTTQRGFSVECIPAIGMAIMGLTLSLAGLRKNLTTCRLLRHGIVGRGKLIKVQRTGYTSNKQPVYELQFEHHTPEGSPKLIRFRTAVVAPLTDESVERLLFDPREPTVGIPIDGIPGEPQPTESGQLNNGNLIWVLFGIMPFGVGAAILFLLLRGLLAGQLLGP